MGYHLQLSISEEEIARIVADLAAKIDSDYREETDLLLVGLLKGSTLFLADLSRAMKTPAAFDFLSVSSYGEEAQSTRDVRILKDLDVDIRDRAVLVVEDVIDTGLTLQKILEMLKMRDPKSLRVCALLDKPAQREVPVTVDYAGKVMGEEFVVGYGMDFAQKHRTLPDIYQVIFDREDL